MRQGIAAVMVLLGCLAVARGQSNDAAAQQLRRHETRYYVMYTDLDEQHVREATIRMTRMAEEYYERTKGFSGRIRSKFPFYLFRNEAMYYQAGGRPGTAGVFMGSSSQGFRLMALAGDEPSDRTWHTVQHEGFHQFAHAVIGGDLPIWVNEGLAEYFGEALFTGDGFVTGVIPQWRLERIRSLMAGDRFMPIEQMMRMSHEEWNARISLANYDQAWAMVHFLAHGDEGRYQNAFETFMNLIGRGTRWDRAWTESFGSPSGFEQKWRKYWMELPDNPTERLYARATLQTLGSFVTRAALTGQTFDDFEAFVTAARAGTLQVPSHAWLPPTLLQDALGRVEKMKGSWALDQSERLPRVTYAMEDRTLLIASATIKDRTVEKISVTIDALPRVVAEARQLFKEDRRQEAVTLLQGGLRRDPRSTAAEEARQLLNEIRQAGRQ